MKVLQVLPALNGGGVSHFLVDFLQKTPQFCETFIASEGGVLLKNIPISVSYFSLPLSSKNPFVIWQNGKRLADIIKKNHIDIIHAHSRAPAWSSLFAAKKTGIKFITTYHGVYNASSYAKRFYNSVMVRSDAIIAISLFIQNHIRETYNPLAPIYYVPEGIDSNHFSRKNVSQEDIEVLRKKWSLPSDKKVILLPGRLTRWKGQKLLLKSLKYLTQEVVVIFVGSLTKDSSYYEELKILSKDYHVIFEDSLNDIRAAYILADLIVSCSTDPEAFGRTTAEALLMEKFYIGPNHGATPELYLNKDFLIPPANPELLGKTINKALTLSEPSRESKENRSHIIKNFSLSKMREETYEVYHSVMKSLHL